MLLSMTEGIIYYFYDLSLITYTIWYWLQNSARETLYALLCSFEDKALEGLLCSTYQATTITNLKYAVFDQEWPSSTDTALYPHNDSIGNPRGNASNPG